MRIVLSLFIVAGFLSACDDTRVYEKNSDFEEKAWMRADRPEFEFTIADTVTRYNLYCNMRNSVSYPYARIFFTYYLQDSLGLVLQKRLVDYTMFDPKTGAPNGTSGLGDIYDHQVPIISGHKFPYAGIHKIKFEQFMRKDTLDGIFAVGVRVERSSIRQ